MSKFAKKIKEGLEDVLAFKEGKLDLRTTNIKIPEPPVEYKPKDIKKIREKGYYSQGVFAKILNVSVKTVRSWEGGQRKPSHATLRLLEIIDKGIYRPEIHKIS